MNRRSLLTAAALAGAGGAAALYTRRAWRNTEPTLRAEQPSAGTSVLTVDSRSLDINGKAARVFGLIGPNGQHGLSFVEGQQFSVSLVNKLSDPTIVHWHGLRPPYEQDGVQNAPLPMVPAGGIRHYSFPVGRAGTHWMHAHTLQEQNLLAAPLIVQSAADVTRDEQQVVVLLHDFSFTPAEELLAKLSGGGMAGMNHGAGAGGGDGMAGMNMDGMNMGSKGPGMAAMDLNDIDYDAYLANDRTLADPEVVRVEKGGREIGRASCRERVCLPV